MARAIKSTVGQVGGGSFFRVSTYDPGTLLHNTMAAGVRQQPPGDRMSVAAVGYSINDGTNRTGAGLVVINEDSSSRWGSSLLGVTTAPLRVGFPVAAVDSSCNAFFVIPAETSTGVYHLLVTKYNPEGVRQWVRKLSLSGVTLNSYGCSVDGAGNLLISGNNGTSLFVAKYNSSGVLQWQKTIATMRYSRIAADVNGNSYVACRPTANDVEMNLIKLDSAGAVVWNRMLTVVAGSVPLQSSDLSVSPDGAYVVVAGQTPVTGSNEEVVVAVFSSAGAQIYSKNIFCTSDVFHMASNGRCAIDNSGRVLLSFDCTVVVSDGMAIAVLDATGAAVMANTLLRASGLAYGRGAWHKDAGSFVVSCETNTSEIDVFVLPNNGTRTGSFTGGSGNYNYTTTTMTIANTAAWTTPASLSTTNFTATDAAGTLPADAAPSHTYFVKRI